MSITIEYLNRCDAAAFVETLQGIYEHSPWVPARAAARRPFKTLVALKLALQSVVKTATQEEQWNLIRAHPELASKAAIAGALTKESAHEQAQAGLNHCTPEEFAALQELNAAYRAKFSFPFILAVKGPDGKGLTRSAIIAALKRRLQHQESDELAENLRQIGRIAELRLNDLFGYTLRFGNIIMEWCDIIGACSDNEDNLTCAYMTEAHRKTAAHIATWMQEAGMQTHIDAVGNVVGRYASDRPGAKTLMTGSHYDTVRNGGKYDGRLGILLPIAVIKHLHEQGERLPFHIEVIGFSDEEGVRYNSTFLGSKAITGQFDMTLLDKQDANGIAMRDALRAAHHDVSRIAAIARNPDDLLGFVEVHIEQGPVLLEQDLPVGVVTSIAGSSRYLVELTGLASHAGTTPMNMRRDAAAAAAEIILSVERRCSQSQMNGASSLVGTVGQLQVPDGSINVIPGMCKFSLDIRAADDETRHAAVNDIMQGIESICAQRCIGVKWERVTEMSAAPCALRLRTQLSAAVERTGIPLFLLPSGAGHDAMAMAAVTGIAMLFTRCGNGGISHHPLEAITADDADISAWILLDFLRHLCR